MGSLMSILIGLFLIHIGMILSTLGLSPHGFVFWASLPKGLIPIGYCPCLYTYKPSHSYPMWDFGRTPNNPPLEQSSIDPPLKSGFFVFHYVRAHILREALPATGSLLTTPFYSISTHTIKPKSGSDTTCWETSWTLSLSTLV